MPSGSKVELLTIQANRIQDVRGLHVVASGLVLNLSRRGSGGAFAARAREKGSTAFKLPEACRFRVPPRPPVTCLSPS